MTSQYRNFLKLLEKWPLDPSKKGRDLGDRIRVCIKAAFNTEQGFSGDSKDCERKYESLNRLINNQHGNSFKRTKTQSSTGLTAQECNLVLSSDFLEYLQQEERSLFANILPKKE